MKLAYYLKNATKGLLPKAYFDWHYQKLSQRFAELEDYIQQRVNYYCPINTIQPLLESELIGQYKRKGNSQYYFDLKSLLHYFPKTNNISYHFGDETHLCPQPTLFKARPVRRANETSVLLKLDKTRHFSFETDQKNWKMKQNRAIFRGAVHSWQPHRISFMQTIRNNELFDVGSTNQGKYAVIDPLWQKGFLSKQEQLEAKFIFCIEGNDVASNLKWVMHSNSIAVSPKMKYETWFMEGTLQADKHYIEVAEDYSDCEEKLRYYLAHPEESQRILDHAHAHTAPFLDEDLETYIGIRVLERYFYITGQL